MIDPAVYWLERGRGFEAEAYHEDKWGVETPELSALLATLHFDSVLDVGCGYGRVGLAIMALKPEARYTGFDVSPDLAAAAARNLLYREVFCADVRTWETPRRWDLVLAVSCLSHLRPTEVEPVVARLRRWATRDLVIVDWAETGKATAYQHAHDWQTLLLGASVKSVGRLAIYHLALRRP